MSDESSEKVQGAPGEAKAMSTSKSSWLGRTLWASQRVAEARATSFSVGDPGFTWFEMARQIGDDVVKIGESGKASLAVLLLETTAAELLVRAHLERGGLPTVGTQLGQAEWDNARTLAAVESAMGKLSPPELSILIRACGPDRDATLAGLSDVERDRFATALHDFVMRLLEPLEIEANRLGRALFARWSRVLIVAIVLALGVGFVGKWVHAKVLGPNIALHCPVTTSSQFPGQGTDHTLLVDGDPETLGFHTQEGGQQWAVIDLGKVRKIGRIVVYNRADGYEERAVPIKIEVSDDNQNYKQIAERKEVFDKWTVKHLHVMGRYVRLKNTPPNYFHLGEVEIYQ
jgi:hypothetical protein